MSVSAALAMYQTALYRLHLELGGRMVPFAGYQLPLHYAGGILREHLHTRSAAGLFDVSHMGQIVLRPCSGGIEDVARGLETLVPADLLNLAEGRQRYGLLTNDSGGILDDLMIAHRGDHLALVVNAACKDDDEIHLRRHLSGVCEIERRDNWALLALQGPAAEPVLAALAPAVAAMRFMEVRGVDLMGVPCVVSRSGYTGEDGFEISVPADAAEALARELMKNPSVMPVGLGARDSLRLEAGLCLYGADIETGTTPVEAALEWSIGKSRRAGGARAGGFRGAEQILGQIATGASRRRVGLRPRDRTPVRCGAPLFRDADALEPIGAVTSGGFGPSVDAPVAMGYVPIDCAQPGVQLHAEVRGRRVSVDVCDLPFVAANYKR